MSEVKKRRFSHSTPQQTILTFKSGSSIVQRLWIGGNYVRDPKIVFTEYDLANIRASVRRIKQVIGEL